MLEKPPLRGISSMATRQVLGQLVSTFVARSGMAVVFESVGGVDAAKRVWAGEAFDLVVLAADAIDKLVDAGRAIGGTRVDLVRSGVAVAVRAGSPLPDLSTEDSTRRAVLAAPTIGYSTGPSGVALLKLFERWGVAQQLASRLAQAQPGVPVGAMVARGDVALGFQQLSELMHVEGVAVAGPLPDAIQIETIFSGAVCATTARASDVREFLAFMASPECDAEKRRQGMAPA
ncbi:substrate-binding domain-containing protein [Rhodoferax ferrireducens]|uniref:substrate-binding domain-containing protein n=1 Tax=Rhodoferax ferrireducens TaxID=192843 RepID=UPI001E4E8371|nr:substrate-binding domain-containing protein [Rhodoferax ferrireducens]